MCVHLFRRFFLGGLDKSIFPPYLFPRAYCSRPLQADWFFHTKLFLIQNGRGNRPDDAVATSFG